MVAGVAGDPGLHVPGAVVGEARPGGDCVTVQPRPLVAQTAVVTTLSGDSAALSHALSQVKHLEYNWSHRAFITELE